MKLKINKENEITKDSLNEKSNTLVAYIKSLREVATRNTYDDAEASINLAFDDDLLERVNALVVEKVTLKLRYIFVVGIGGSNLGTKAVYDALYGYRDTVNEDRPQMIFVDTTNAAKLRFYTETLFPTLTNAEEFLIVTISKSGGTTETLANTEIMLAAFKKKFSGVKDRTVVITDEGSAFWDAAKETGVAHLSIPRLVGGRYSILSAVGLFPLAALGVDIQMLRQGARDIRPYCISENTEDNPAAQSAALMALAQKQGKTINDTFVFNSELESLGKWYRQLLGESIGKEHDIDGNQVHVGITPSVSVGSTDLHSVGQLYLGGPKDKLTTFVYSTDDTDTLVIPDTRVFPSVVTMIDEKTTDDIVTAILGGVKIAYNKNQLPFMEVQLEGITPYEMGAFMQFKMIEMMYLGRLMHVNPFDQPNVESYKIETKQLLEA